MNTYYSSLVLQCLIAVSIAIIALLFSSVSTSPLHTECFYGDSAVFQLIGKYWTEGHLPYVQLWDLKGPLIFFINAIGFKLTNNSSGVFLLQVIALSSAIIIAYRWLTNFLCPQWALCYTLLMTLHSITLGQRGNTVGEFILPFMTGSFYLLFRWCTQRHHSFHPPRYAFIYGIAFATCALTRLVNAIPLCTAILYVTFYLITLRQWHNFIHNCLAFSLGFLSLTLPFIFYFYIHDALPDLWYGTIGYNLEYLQHPSHSFTPAGFISALWKAHLTDALCLFFLSAITLFIPSTQKRWSYLSLFSITPLLFWLLHSNGYSNYAQATLPLFPWGIYLATLLWNRTKTFKALLLLLLIPNSYPFLSLGYQQLKGFCNPNKIYFYDRQELSQYDQILSTIPYQDKTSIIGYNIDPTLFLNKQLCPSLPYFNAQDFEISQSTSLKKRILESFSNNPPQYILVYGSQTALEPFFVQHYLLLKKDTISPPPNPTLYCTPEKTSLRLYRLNSF